jgi:predicted O-linked N-acetylglucosamine transferase (SPINDLY family)
MTLNEIMQRAQAAFARGDWAGAEQLCKTILNSRSDFVEALSLLGILKAQTQRPEEAADLLRRVVEALPNNPVAHNNYGNILTALRRHEAALGSYDRAVELKSDYAEAHNSRGNVLRDLKRFDAALSSYERAVALQSNYADAHYNRGVTLHVLDRLEDALESYARAIAANPRFADAHYNRGMALSSLRRLDEALRSYSHALEFKPRFAEALNNQGNALQDLGRHDEALRSFQRALEIKPDLAEGYYNRGRALQHLKRLDDALSSYQSALKINPELDWLYGAWLYVKMQLCDWNDIGAQATALLHKISLGQRAARPFTVLALTDELLLQRQAAQLSAQENESLTRLPAPNHVRKRSDRIRIGYYSADFHSHATAYLAAGLFECHDKARFDIVAFSFGPDARDAMRARLALAFNQFLDVRALSDGEISRKSRDMEIDIAVDLKGFSQDARPGIFALRAAPIQVIYLIAR